MAIVSRGSGFRFCTDFYIAFKTLSEAVAIVAPSLFPNAGECMMWRSIFAFCLVLAAGPGVAQDATRQGAPLDAITVSGFLASCDKDMSQCDFELRQALLNKLDIKGSPQVCLKDAHYQTAVITWLRAHPETHAMATDDGIYTAYKSLYPCP
jgi:hypothetical protein